jgi:uncharacterized repeat protein (TIGR04052 family)
MKRVQLGLCLWLTCACGAAGSAVHDVTIPFEVVVGTHDFRCGQTYELGAPATAFTPLDLRFFVHGLRVVDGAGREHALELLEDDAWQTDGIALLDFEGDTPECEDGTPETNHLVRASADVASYERLRFRLGVPFALNHSPETSAPSPLNLSTMFWTWQDGYKFMRFEGDATGRGGWIFHLGSSGCNGGLSGGTTSCAEPNVVDVDIPFAPGQEVALDLAALLSGSDFAAADDVGCMSEAADPECAPLFARLGLGDSPQKVFSAR